MAGSSVGTSGGQRLECVAQWHILEDARGCAMAGVLNMTIVSKTLAPHRLAALLVGACIAAAPAVANELNDYPTAARVDYVFGCMKANGETRQALEQCSCSIDVISSILSYDRYVHAETLLSIGQVPGERGGTFRSAEPSKAALNDLRRAQAEAEVRCF
jgi:hypothetical protein